MSKPLSKSPTKSTSGSVSGPATLRHQRSRILGHPSDTSLRSKIDLEKTSATASDATKPPDVQDRPETANDKAQNKRTATEAWSLWPKKQSVSASTAPKGDTSPIKSSRESVYSNSAEPQQDKDDVSIHSTADSTKPTRDRDRENSWISWRKPSFTSLRKAAESQQQADASDIESQATQEPSTSDPVKSFATETSRGPNMTSASSAASSWAFWNSSNTAEYSKNSNVLLNGGDAVLFERVEINETPNTHKSPTKKAKVTKQHIPNKVVPEFNKSLPLYTTTKGLINNYNRLKYTLGFDVQDPKHLYRTEVLPSSIKKVLIIGVHGFFPTKVLRPLIGEPTGTSIKFANEAEKAINRWAEKEQLNVVVQKIALEKEGKIFDRVNFFYEVMKKWQKDIEDADYIYIAAHSQGCPVSIILLAKLITEGVIKVNGRLKISILAMAGVNTGPFYGADQRILVRALSTIESDSLMELFQFQNFDSIHAKEFIESLKTIISHNVKITFVGSINDQLVPLYSSTCLHVRHPNIFRATYIDGSSNTPDFVSRAVSIANHLHNLGYSDHGLIKEISNSLAGPLTGGGHSKIYNDPQVYDLALNFSLYTSDLKYQIPLHFKPFFIEQLGTNPYHLPWCMRGLLFEARAKFPARVIEQDINDLFEEFENWKPETKQLKDMKYRLNGIKSKL